MPKKLKVAKREWWILVVPCLFGLLLLLFVWHQKQAPPVIRNPEIIDLDISSDGHFIATVDRNGYVQVWNSASKQLLWAAPAIKGAGRQVKYSPQGTFLATVDYRGQVNLIDTRGKILIQAIPKQLTPQGKIFVTISTHFLNNENGLVLVGFYKNPTTQKHESGFEVWKKNKQGIFVFSYSRKNSPWVSVTESVVSGAGRFLVKSDSNSLEAWNLSDGQLAWRLKGHFGNSMTTMTDGKFIIVPAPRVKAMGTMGIAFYDVKTGQQRSFIDDQETNSRGLFVSPDGRLLAQLTDGGTVQIWDIERKVRIGNPLKGFGSNFRAFAFTSDSKQILHLTEKGIETQTVIP